MKSTRWTALAICLGILWLLFFQKKPTEFPDSFPDILENLKQAPEEMADSLPDWSTRQNLKSSLLPSQEEGWKSGGRIRFVGNGNTPLGLAPIGKPVPIQGKARFVTLFGKGAQMVQTQKTLRAHPDDNGDWVVKDLPAGRFAVVSLDPSQAVRFPRMVEVLEGKEQVIPVELLPAGSLRVSVTDPDGTPLPQQPVLLFRSAAVFDQPFSWESRFALRVGGSTDENGIIRFEGLPMNQSFLLLAGNNREFQAVERKPVSPTGQTEKMVLKPFPRMRLHVVDAITGKNVEEFTFLGAMGESSLALSSLRLDPFPFPGGKPGIETVDLVTPQDKRNPNLIRDPGLRVGDHTTFFITAKGYIPSGVILDRPPPVLVVKLFPISKPGGLVRDASGGGVPGAEVSYRLDSDSGETSGVIRTDGEGYFKIPFSGVSSEPGEWTISMDARVPGHPEKGFAVVEDVPLGRKGFWYATLDLTLLPRRDLDVMVHSRGAFHASYAVIMKMTSSGGRILYGFSGLGREFHGSRSCITGSDGEGTLQGIPRKGWAWICVRALEQGRLGSCLGVFGPFDLASLDSPLELDVATQESWLQIQLEGDSMKKVSVSLFPMSLPAGEEITDLPFWGEQKTFQVRPGSPMILGPLLPGLHSVSVQGSGRKPRDFFFAPGQILDLGVLPGKVVVPESAGSTDQGH